MLNEQVELTGTVHHGVIVIDEGIELAEGQTVKIIVMEPAPETHATNGAYEAPSTLSPLTQKMLSHARTVADWPADFALNHDHYLYGADKR